MRFRVTWIPDKWSPPEELFPRQQNPAYTPLIPLLFAREKIDKRQRSRPTRRWLKVIGGAISAGVGVWLIAIFAPQVLKFLQGIAGIAVAVIGLVVLAIGISELKE